MLVVMQPESSRTEIGAVCQRAREAGFEATVFDTEPGIILVAGEHGAEAAEQFADLPGVAWIAVVCLPRSGRSTSKSECGVEGRAAPIAS